jgi:hypothetical protein
MRTEADAQDRQLMGGCASFITTSLVCYLLSIWPFIFADDLWTSAGLARAMSLGFIPPTIFGIISTRRFAVAGACGWVAAALTTAIFLLVRIQNLFTAGDSRQFPMPVFSRDLIWVLPVGYVIAVITLSLLVLPRGATGLKPETESE